MNKKKNIAVFASGSGSNFQRIAEYFADSDLAQVCVMLCNKAEAGVFARAEKLGIEAVHLDSDFLRQTERLLLLLSDYKVDFIVLAGYLKKIPPLLVNTFEGRMLNIHPALLPKYGGKGMYGMNVHQAVKEAGERETGITIHRVNNHYDEGAIVRQEKVAIDVADSPEDIAEKVHQLEYEYYPKVIEQELRKA